MLLVYGFQCKEKIYDLKKLKTFRTWVSVDFHGTKNCYRWFPMIFGHRTEILFSVWFEMCGSRKYPYPPPSMEDSLICTPIPQDFPFQGVFEDLPPPRKFQTGTSLNTLWKWTPLPFGISNDHLAGGGGGGMDFFWNHTILGLRNMILRLPCTCQWTVDLIRKSGFCSKSQNPTVDFNNVFKVDFK